MHNKGQPCERIFAYLEHIKKRDGLEGWPAFKKMLEVTKSPARRKLIDPELHMAADEVMKEVYKEAIDANGLAHPDKVPTLKQIREAMAGRAETSLLDAHHTAVQTWTRKLIPGITQNELDEMPGLILRQADHRIGRGEGAFHKILSDLMPYGSTDDKTTILENLREAYRRFYEVPDGAPDPDVWRVAREWLRSKGVS